VRRAAKSTQTEWAALWDAYVSVSQKPPNEFQVGDQDLNL